MKGITVLAALALAAAGIVAATAGASSIRVPRHCPVHALALPHDATARAAHAAVAQAARSFPGLDTRGARVVSSRVAIAAGPRGAEVALQCGAQARHRTVVVELRFPRMAPSASMSEGVVDVSRFAAGYRVWAIVH